MGNLCFLRFGEFKNIGDKMTVGQRIRHIREKNSLLLKEVGAICNISVLTLSRYENGDRKPDFEFLEKFIDYFKVSADWSQENQPSEISPVSSRFFLPNAPTSTGGRGFWTGFIWRKVSFN